MGNYSKIEKKIENQEELYNLREFKEFDEIRFNKILKFIPKKKNIKMLNVGCGSCNFYDSLAKVRKNVEFFGLDNSSKQVEVSKKKGYKVLKHDLSKKFPYEDNSFDFVIATEIIEHLFDTDSFLQEINRILKKDGTIILTTPNIASFGARFRLFFLGQRPSTIEAYSRTGTSGHIRAFDFDDLVNLFKFNNF